MRIGVNTLFMIPGEVGGSETGLRRTLRAIAARHPEVELVLFTNRENEQALRSDLQGFSQVSYVSLGFAATNRHSRILREQFQLPWCVRKSRVDLLWSPGYTAPYFCSCPMVTLIYDMQYKSHPNDLTLTARLATDFLVKVASRRSAAIVAPSEFSKSEIHRYTGASSDRIHVIPLAVDRVFAERLPAPVSKARLEALGCAGAPYILVVSNTYPHKNIHAAVSAFGEIAGEIPHRLVIVGRPRLAESAVNVAIRALPDAERVRRMSMLAPEDLMVLYQGADLLLMPSLYEGFGLPVLEAMMAGVPVLTTRMASIPEVGGDTVEYFDPGIPGDFSRKIRKALACSPAERETRIAAAVERAKGFTWEKTASATVDLFGRVLADQNPRLSTPHCRSGTQRTQRPHGGDGAPPSHEILSLV